MRHRQLIIDVVSAAAVAFCLFGLARADDVKKTFPDRTAYDFHDTDAYRALSADEKAKLDTVQRDFAVLWGALDRFAEEHSGLVPKTLSELVPRYLSELPRDPFVKDGSEYRYQPGCENAWYLASEGLQDFPFPARVGNFGLYVCKGYWLGGKNVCETRKTAGGAQPAQQLYDFRDSDVYQAMSPEQKARLEPVWRDFAMLWGALDMYAQRHGGKTPDSLDQLVPVYLPELPRDPFAAERPAERQTADCLYGYMPGSNAWVLSSGSGGKKGQIHATKGTWFTVQVAR